METVIWAAERGALGATCPGPPKMFELYVFDVTKIKDSDITDGSWVRAIVIALKMQGNSVSERWSPKRGAPRTGTYYIHDVIKGPKSIICPGPHKTSRRPWLSLAYEPALTKSQKDKLFYKGAKDVFKTQRRLVVKRTTFRSSVGTEPANPGN